MLVAAVCHAYTVTNRDSSDPRIASLMCPSLHHSLPHSPRLQTVLCETVRMACQQLTVQADLIRHRSEQCTTATTVAVKVDMLSSLNLPRCPLHDIHSQHYHNTRYLSASLSISRYLLNQ